MGLAVDDPLIGKVIRGNYRVMKRIGSGAMGAIYTAEQLSLSRVVAVKVLHRHLLTDENLLKRFHREAQAAALLKHPNTIDILEFGQAEDGSLYIAMEFVSGRDLADTLDHDGPLEFPRIVRILKQVCLALDQAHEKGIIHRDLKPENIMLEPRKTEPDFVKVLDFGIAKIQDPERKGDRWQTMAGLVCGTPEYMAPEQARGEVLDSRCDLYALGIIIYQLVTQQLPFTGDSPISIVTRHLTDPVEPPSKLRPDVPPALEDLCLRLVAKNRDERPRSAMEVYDELTALEATFGSPAAARPRAAAPLPVERVPASTTPSSPNDSATVLFNLDAHRPLGGRRNTPATSPERRPTWFWPAVALVVSLMVVVVGLVITGQGEPSGEGDRTPELKPVGRPSRSSPSPQPVPPERVELLVPTPAGAPKAPATAPVVNPAVIPVALPQVELERRDSEPAAARLERRPPALSASVVATVEPERRPKPPVEKVRPEKVPPEKPPIELPTAEDVAAKAAAKAAAAAEASERATTAESAGQYAVAARAWAEAYALKPQANLLKKMGFAQAKAGDTAQACKSFQRYVKSLPAERRAGAVSALAAYECVLTL